MGTAGPSIVLGGTDRRFALRVLDAGIGVTLGLAAAGLGYLALTWDHPHRLAIALILSLAAGDAVAIATFRRWLSNSPKLGIIFAGWNGVHTIAASIAAYLDGGPGSPFVAVLFVSVAFAAVSLTRTWVITVAAFDLAALLGVAVASQSWPTSLIFAGGALMTTAGVCTTIAGERHERLTEVQEARAEMLRRLARVVEFRDFETGMHIERMSEYCALIASRLGWSREDVERLRLGATMHDIGKVAVPDSILLKPGALTVEERATVELHANVGHQMLAGSSSPEIELAAQIALTHHERFDGSGYPAGLSGADIPLVGRIVAVADVFDALTTDRVYRPAMTVGDALKILYEGRGSDFDPRVLDAFDEALDEILSVRARFDEPSAGVPFIGADRHLKLA